MDSPLQDSTKDFSTIPDRISQPGQNMLRLSLKPTHQTIKNFNQEMAARGGKHQY